MISAYTSRGIREVTLDEKEELKRYRFPLPQLPEGTGWVVNRADRKEEIERIKKQLYLLHTATGHCSTRHLVDALKRRGARPEVIKLAEEFRCSVCVEKKRVMPRHVASLEPLPPKFHTVSADVGHWYHPQKQQHVQFLLVIDEGSRFRVARVVSKGQKQQPSGATCVQYLQEGWSQIFGQPRTLRLDPAGNFRSHAVEQFCDQQGIFLDLVPGEARWKIGVCEQAVQGVKDVMDKLVAAEHELEPEEALATAIRTFNQRDMIRGFSPVQRVLGQAPDETATPALPSELLVENPSGEFQRSVQRRQEAEKALVDRVTRQRVVRAQNSRSRKLITFLPEELVFFWRQQETGKNPQGPTGKQGRFVGPARILAMERKSQTEGTNEGSSAVWLVRGRSLIKVCVEQLRHASPRGVDPDAVGRPADTVVVPESGNQYEDLSQMIPSESEWSRAQDANEEVQLSHREPTVPVLHRFRGKRPALEPPVSDNEELIPAEPSSSSRRRRPVGYTTEELRGERWADQIPEAAWFQTEQGFWNDETVCVEVEIEMPASHRGWQQASRDLECYMLNALKRKAVEVSEKHLNLMSMSENSFEMPRWSR